MAKSPAHKLGQIVGDEIEAAIREPLQDIADEFNLYLDHRHPRPARANKRKVAWEDSYGNVHDLDYVLEEGGDEHTLGVPRAFIEIAWRRYTKHSRNKVQEIQGAVLPVAERYIGSAPFLGAVLAGDFTEASRDQLRSHGFHMAYLSYEMIVEAFRGVGVAVFFDEGTTAGELRAKVRSYGRLFGGCSDDTQGGHSRQLRRASKRTRPVFHRVARLPWAPHYADRGACPIRYVGPLPCY